MTNSQQDLRSKGEVESLGTKKAERILAYLDEPPWLQRFRFWRGDAGDPELRKLLGRMHLGIVTAQRLDQASEEGISDEGRGRFCHLLARDPRDLSIDAALEVVDALDQLLIEHGDKRYLRDTLAAEIARDRIDTTATTWSHVFGKPPSQNEIDMVDTGRDFDESGLMTIKNQLAALYRTRSVLYDLHRARQALKSRHLWLLAPVLAGLLIAFGAATYAEGEALASIALVVVSGALGAALSGTFKLRDQIQNINDLRAFSPSVAVQPLIGAVAGLVLLLVLDSRLINVSWGGPDWANRGAIAFVAGFSEPFFLGIVGRVAAIGEVPAASQQPKIK